jgi:hypothetical protein
MTNERNGKWDVRWLDEIALHAAVVDGDPEAFAELMRRYDPVVRDQVWRMLAGSRLVACDASLTTIDERVAEFWCWLLDGMEQLREWDPDQCGLLASWLAMLAARSCADRLRALLRLATRAA